MINTDNKHFFFIEPDKEAEPAEMGPMDIWTMCVSFILQQSYVTSNLFWFRGVHTTRHGMKSGNAPIYTPMNRKTNTLAKYYVMFFREHVPKDEFRKIIDELACIAGVKAPLELGDTEEEKEVKQRIRGSEEAAHVATILLMQVAEHLQEELKKRKEA